MYSIQVSCPTSVYWTEPIGFWARGEDANGEWFEHDETFWIEIVPVSWYEEEQLS